VRVDQLGIGGSLALSLLSTVALAQTYGINSITSSSPNLGTIISGPVGTTVFTVSPSGSVSSSGGSAIQIATAGTAAPTVTVRCTSSALCNTTDAIITISNIGSPTNRAGPVTNFTATMGTTVLETGSSLGPASPLTFTIKPIAQGTTQTFKVGMDFPVLGDDSGANTGTSVSNFQVSIMRAPSGTVVSRTATGATAKVFRALSIAHADGDDLMFGRIAPPKTGNAFVKVTAAGVLTVSGNGLALTPTSARAALFTVVGEGSSRFSISLPTPITLTSTSNPSDTLAITLIPSATSSHSFGGSLGSSVTYPFTVGGSFNLPSTQSPGTYQGSMMLTLQYE
jgi:hypothetical protein